jgi:hypothetical protein
MGAPMNALPTNIDIAKARLPATYEQAKITLASCAKIDECQEWANKAEALASYARMADDDSLRTMADRIQAHAVRRMGEILRQFDAQGRRTDQPKEGALQKLTQTEMAESAGISEHQRKQAVRVAKLPAEKFEAAVEAPKPATVTELSEMGKKIRAAPESFKQATALIGAVTRFDEFCRTNSAASVAEGLLPEEIAKVRVSAARVYEWLNRLDMALDRAEAAPRAPEAEAASREKIVADDYPDLPAFLDRRSPGELQWEEAQRDPICYEAVTTAGAYWVSPSFSGYPDYKRVGYRAQFHPDTPDPGMDVPPVLLGDRLETVEAAKLRAQRDYDKRRG